MKKIILCLFCGLIFIGASIPTGQRTKICDDTNDYCNEIKEYDSEKRILVQSKIDVSANGSVPTINNSLRYDDMNGSTGGVNRETTINTTWTNIYSYSGKGLLFGFAVVMEDEKKWYYRLVVDGQEIFGPNGIFYHDMEKDDIYDFMQGSNNNEHHIGILLSNKGFHWESPLQFPMRFATSVVLKVKHASSSKKFRGGLIALSKE